MKDLEYNEMEKRLYAATDAKVWAEEFCSLFAIARRVNPYRVGSQIGDEGLMTGWFANAMETAKTHSNPPSFFDDVRTFHEAFNLRIGSEPELPDHDDQQLRLELIREEYAELRSAHADQDIVAIADAIADLVYVACGMAVAYGIPLNQVWDAVQKANMEKLGPNGPIYREDGKVLKPEGWQAADIREVIFGA